MVVVRPNVKQGMLEERMHNAKSHVHHCVFTTKRFAILATGRVKESVKERVCERLCEREKERESN